MVALIIPGVLAITGTAAILIGTAISECDRPQPPADDLAARRRRHHPAGKRGL